MPIYEYECEKCGHRVERFQNFQDEEVKTCEKCGGPVRRLISRTAFVLKGSGWYLTDYPSKSRKEGIKAEKKTEGGETKGEKGKKEKSETT
ncbi:MAG: zinc ribbon domain-containing protein [Candidatus Latescibacteria bacterium]|nr:zinc ribbon domain-containing protein [Candidatus Latescibacterota bacterium]